MATRQYRSSTSRRFVFPVVISAIVAYFGYHAFHGDYGIAGRAVLASRTAQLEAEFGRLEAERKELEVRVALLRAGSLDQDMLDEEARRQLSMVHPAEIVILRAADAAVQKN